MTAHEFTSFLFEQPLLSLAMVAIFVSIFASVIRRPAPGLARFLQGTANLGLAAALLVVANLRAVATDRHRAPGAGPVARGVVEREGAAEAGAALEARPRAVAHGIEERGEDASNGRNGSARGGRGHARGG